MMNCLIYFDVSNLAPVGGPAGYLYGLKQGLDEIGCKQIEFLSTQSRTKSVVKSMNASFVKVLGKAAVYSRAIGPMNHRAKVNIDRYDFVHFHVVKDMYEARDSLNEYKGNVLFTPHSPCAPYSEVMDKLSSVEKRLFWKIYQKLPDIDRYAFERADTLIFPCEEAEEAYYNSYPWYESTRRYKRVEYCLTGSIQKRRKSPKGYYREKYEIPDNAFVISYVGRHEEIKGYDFLIELGKVLIQNYPDVWILVAGSEGPIFAPNSKNWIEVGWTDDAGGIIDDSDLFLLPNKQTYFDLVLLECLSLGTPVLTSKTGGNKYFLNSGIPGVYLYDDINTCLTHVRSLRSMKVLERRAIGDSNIRAYNELFNEKSFARRYIKMLEKMSE